MNHLLQRLAEAWNAGDAAAYADLFTEDADYITYFGLHLRGREAIEATHRKLFELPIKIDMGVGEPQVKELAPTVRQAIVQGGSNGRASVVSFTAVETGEGWRFAFFQNTRVTKP
ncbi:SgcJ/EcaC family oxidoreductase [Nonomuraea sp. NPDC049152]|uniref:SgcJ/EcaC family oxidoreductase n=1 Tax=Nonomuraea sp. NPDC049152 TaxID=3154350 RepID=UPI0033CEBEF7